MSRTPYHRTCGRTVRKFYDDFDLLPFEMRQLLANQETMPNFDDLRAAWDLAAETMDITDIKRYLNTFEKENKEENKKKADEERRLMREAKAKERSLRKYGSRFQYTPVYRNKMMKRDDKHARLVTRITDEEEIVRALTTRKENKDVVAAPTSPFFVKRELVGYKKTEIKQTPEIKYQENLPVTHIVKALHNG